MNVKRVAGVSVVVLIGIAVSVYFVHGLLRGRRTVEREDPVAAAPGNRRQVPVVLTPVSVRGFEERLVVQGNLEAKNLAMVSARVPGTIDRIFVDEGDRVIAGETKLFQIDSVKLQKTVEVRSQDLAVAQVAEREKQANLERVEADFHKAELDYERFKRLREQDAVTPDALENQESRYKQAKALVKHAKTLVDLSIEQKKQAEAALAIAQKDLSDSLVYAPITGSVSQRMYEQGETGKVGEAIIRIEDTTVLEVNAYLPAQYYARVRTGETRVDVSVYDIEIPDQTISYKSPTINPQMPTFELKCVLHDPPEGIVPNAMAQVTVFLERHRGLGVPSSAIQLRGDTPVVFLIENGLARTIQVETGQETDGWTEILADALPEGTPVVSMGQFLLEEDTPVTIQEGGI